MIGYKKTLLNSYQRLMTICGCTWAFLAVLDANNESIRNEYEGQSEYDGVVLTNALQA
jgi:hypothetical protein